jgi:hypothetical protein
MESTRPLIGSRRHYNGIGDASDNQYYGKQGRAVVTDLIGYRQNNSGQDKMQKRPLIAVGKLEKCNHQTNEACHSDDVKNGGHEKLTGWRNSLTWVHPAA